MTTTPTPRPAGQTAPRPRRTLRLGLAAMIGLAMPACVATEYAEDTIEKHKDLTLLKRQELLEELDSYKKRKISTYADRIWIGDAPRLLKNSTRPLPDSIRAARDFTLITAVPVDLTTITRKLSELTGISTVPELDAATPQGQMVQASVRYAGGDLQGLLDEVAQSFSAHWLYREADKEIVFIQTITRIFDFYAPPNQVTTSNSISNSGGASGGGTDGGGTGDTGGTGSTGTGSSSTSTSISQNATFNEWEDIERSLTNILPRNSRLSLSPSTGKITVTTTPRAMRQIAELIHARNAYFTEQIHLAVQVLEVGISGEDAYRLNFQNIDIGQFLASTLGASVRGLTFNSIGGAFAQPNIGSTFTYNDAENNGVNAVITALSTFGRVSVLTTANTRTRNGKPTPIQSTVNTAYLARRSTTTDSQTGTIMTEIIPGQVSSGFFMRVRPRILDRERIQIDLAVTIDTLNEIRPFGSGAEQVQQPETTSRSFTQETIVPNRSTLVISGFEQKRNSANRRGTGHHDNLLLGGNRDASTGRTVIIILVTPTLIKA